MGHGGESWGEEKGRWNQVGQGLPGDARMWTLPDLEWTFAVEGKFLHFSWKSPVDIPL